jgi:GNAT superfamily N-acetyltransferase
MNSQRVQRFVRVFSILCLVAQSSNISGSIQLPASVFKPNVTGHFEEQALVPALLEAPYLALIEERSIQTRTTLGEAYRTYLKNTTAVYIFTLQNEAFIRRLKEKIDLDELMRVMDRLLAWRRPYGIAHLRRALMRIENPEILEHLLLTINIIEPPLLELLPEMTDLALSPSMPTTLTQIAKRTVKHLMLKNLETGRWEKQESFIGPRWPTAITTDPIQLAREIVEYGKHYLFYSPDIPLPEEPTFELETIKDHRYFKIHFQEGPSLIPSIPHRILAVCGNVVLGHANFEKFTHELHLESLRVAEGLRGLEIGTFLMSRLINVARAQTIWKITGESNDKDYKNTKTIYEHMAKSFQLRLETLEIIQITDEESDDGDVTWWRFILHLCEDPSPRSSGPKVLAENA